MARPGTFTSVTLTAAELNDLEELTSWTPTWTNVTVGNGVVTAKYTFVQGRLTGRVELVFGTTTSISGTPRVTLPSGWTTDDIQAAEAVGKALFADTGTANYYGICRPATTTTVDAVLTNVSGTYAGATAPSSTVPHTWATTDVLVMNFTVLGTF